MAGMCADDASASGRARQALKLGKFIFAILGLLVQLRNTTGRFYLRKAAGYRFPERRLLDDFFLADLISGRIGPMPLSKRLQP